MNDMHGFLGMFGFVNCTQLWKNCPIGEQCQYQDKDGTRSLIMETIATQNLWIWHAYIGLPR